MHKGFWSAEDPARTDYSMFMGTLFLIIVGGGGDVARRLVGKKGVLAKKACCYGGVQPDRRCKQTGNPRRRILSYLVLLC